MDSSSQSQPCADANALAPCPFCGEKDELYPSHHGMGGGKPYAIDCLGCGIDFVPREHIDVIAAWNRRAITDEMVARGAKAVWQRERDTMQHRERFRPSWYAGEVRACLEAALGATASPTPDTGNAKVAAQVGREGSREVSQ